MHKAAWIMLSTIGVPLSAAVLADDATFSETTDAALSTYVPYAASAYSPNRRSFHLTDLDFRDDSTLVRVGKLRNLSLLTLVKVGQGRLFLGVNDDGLMGLHFNAGTRGGDERYLEMARVPKLKKNAADDVAD